MWMHSSKIGEVRKIVKKGSVNHCRPSNVLLSLITSRWSKKTNYWSILWGSIVTPSWCNKIYKTLFQPKRFQRTSDPFVLAQFSLLPVGAFWFWNTFLLTPQLIRSLGIYILLQTLSPRPDDKLALILMQKMLMTMIAEGLKKMKPKIPPDQFQEIISFST